VTKLSLICIIVLACILVAGLWPFHAPKNDVSWAGDGLRFGPHGSAISVGPFENEQFLDGHSGTVEAWLKPSSIKGLKAILAFTGSGGENFALLQEGDALVVQRQISMRAENAARIWFRAPGVFHPGRNVFVAISFGPQGTAAFVNGRPAGETATLGLSAEDFTGRLIVGNFPTANEAWSGELHGLAVYGRSLTASQMAQHYQSWVSEGGPPAAPDGVPLAVYLFNEGSGTIAHNKINRDGTASQAADLAIPAHYFIYDPTFLNSPRRDYSGSWGYWQDVVVNVAGFIPLGACFAAYFSNIGWKFPLTSAIGFGLFISLLIEGLQVFLPTRNSSLTDLMTNTAGTIAGVITYRSLAKRGAFTFRGAN
jgi:concanavalin A-like lectin/glucanase superfamily protein/VanZ like protein